MEMTYHVDPSGFGLRRVQIRREENGFGFTLRHFIVYPPELYNSNNSLGDERRRKPLVKVTEPVDTIFVRSVVPHGAADAAGLCVGDRIVSVNGKTIFGNNYETVVQLIQKSPDLLCLEVSPKQYDTLQLFFEETAYRPETNQRPYQNSLSGRTNYTDHHFRSNSLFPHFDDVNYQLSSNTSTESFFLNPKSQQGSMSSSHPHSSSSNPQLFSHLPRPTPYKSTPVGLSNSGQSQQSQRRPQPYSITSKNQPQAYYPFNQDFQSSSQSFGASHLCKIKEEPTSSAKSVESVLSTQCNAVEFEDHLDTSTSQCSGSMECLTAGQPKPNQNPSEHWNPIRSGQRFASYDEGSRPESSSQRRESTGSIPNSNVQSAMVVTMASTNSKIQASYPPELALSDSGSSLGSSYYSTGQGYETRIVDRIRRSCEQKEEFLKRPNQPLMWTPLKSSSTPFPKELYAQPQKFEKIPWPPEHIVPTVTSAKVPYIQSCHTNSGSFDSQMKNMNVSVVNVQHYPDYPNSSLSTNSPPLISTESYDGDRVSNSLIQIQSSSLYHSPEPRSLSPSWLYYAPRNRTTIVGSRKLHCDPPPDWKPDLASLTQKYGQDKETVDSKSTSIPNDGAGEVKFRHRDDELDETERLVRRVSYLKATSSPIDMDRKSASPTSPTLSCGVIGKATSPIRPVVPLVPDVVGRRRSVANKLSAEFFPKGRIKSLKQYFEERTQPTSIFKFSSDSPTPEHRGGGFGSLLGVRNPDNSEVTREGQIHYKIRLGESKRGGYNRSGWRQGWAILRKSGCLYIASKEPSSRDSVTITEDSVILALSLRSGVTVEQAEDYSKRKNVLRIKTSYSSVDIATLADSNFTNPIAHPPLHSTPVEILIQADDANDFLQWLQCLHTQLENNNYCNGNASSFKGIYFGPDFCPKQKSLLTSFLPSPATSSSHNSQSSDKPSTSTTNNTLQPSNFSIPLANVASPKNKTWKGKVARQWKKVHNIIETGGDSKGSSPYTSIPPVGATFGINLEDCPPGDNNPLIPRVIEYSIDVVEKKGIDMVGLYRIPGNNASVATLTERLNKGEEPNPEKDPKWLDVHVVASLIKSFLRRLPDPLLTDDRYQAFIVAADDSTEDADKCKERMQMLINDLPDTNYETLRVVIMHLKNVAEHGASNRMDARNLAIVFGPTIVRTAEENVTSMVQDMKNQCKIVELLISNADELFPERRFKKDSPVPENQPFSISKSGKTKRQVSSADDLNKYNISDALRLPTTSAVHFFTNAENTSVPPPVSPSSPTIESELKASLVQAALRKASQNSSDSNSSSHNVYGLPTKLPKKGKPIDDAGFIRSYAGLNEETEQRVRKFELETRAMLSREDRSPHASVVNVGSKPPPGTLDDFKLKRLMNLDDDIQKAKADLENEDIYDQLVSSIILHRDRGLPIFSVTSDRRNLSSSSISSSNSNGTVPQTLSHSSTASAFQKLGPTPFKSSFAPHQSLPPKPPNFHNSGTSVTAPASNQSKSSLSSTSSLISSLRRVSSMDRIQPIPGHPGLISDSDPVDRKLGSLSIGPKYFGGSLDSLKDITQHPGNGHSNKRDAICDDFSPRSSEGSDLVTSLSRTLDKKLQTLRSSQGHGESTTNDSCCTNTSAEPILVAVVDSICASGNGDISSDKPEDVAVITDGSKKSTTKSRHGGNGIKKNWRRKSMIERRVNGEVRNEPVVKECTAYKDTNYYRNPSLHRMSGVEFTTPTQGEHSALTKEAKTATNKLTRDCRRRHSLSGGGALSIAYHDKSIKYFDDSTQLEDHQTPLGNDCISAAGISRAGSILESHV